MDPARLNDDPLFFARLLGIEVTRADPEAVEGEMRVRAELCTSGEIGHGGAIMAFADALGAVVTPVNLPADSSGSVAVESKTSFFRGGPAGARLIGRTVSLHRGRSPRASRTGIETEGGKSSAMVTRTQVVLR